MADAGFWEQVAVQAVGGLVGGVAGVVGAVWILRLERRATRSDRMRRPAAQLRRRALGAVDALISLQAELDGTSRRSLRASDDELEEMERKDREAFPAAASELRQSMVELHFELPREIVKKARDSLTSVTLLQMRKRPRR